jgi:hypothetical protein
MRYPLTLPALMGWAPPSPVSGRGFLGEFHFKRRKANNQKTAMTRIKNLRVPLRPLRYPPVLAAFQDHLS